MAFFNHFIFFVVFCFVRGEGNCGWKLLMANVVYRHGDRSPEHSYPNDEHIDYWKQGLGQLTERGMSQEFSMGEFLKKRYIPEILNQEYLRKQVYCRSSDKDRTLMSAEAQMAGLYPPILKEPLLKEKNWQFWQLVPIHTVPKPYDQLLRPYSYDCPTLNQIQEESFNDPEYVKMENENKRFLKRISKKMGLTEPLTLANQYQAYDTFFCQKSHNLTLPKWLTESDYNRMKEMHIFTFNWMFNTAEKSKFTGGNLLGEIISNMKNYKRDPENSKKLFVYSAHDTTLAALLNALNIYSEIPPPYSTAFMIELYHYKNSKKYFVRTFLRNDTALPNHAYELTIPGCQTRKRCSLYKFTKFTRSAVPTDFDAECKRDHCAQGGVKRSDNGFSKAMQTQDSLDELDYDNIDNIEE